MSGGVSNLRAMFENKDQSTSPPDRGRSPAGSYGGRSSGPSPRPLSKVRTSFVAVERSGQVGNQLGLKKGNSDGPASLERVPSQSIDEEIQAKQKEPASIMSKSSKDTKSELSNTTAYVKEADRTRDIAGGDKQSKREDQKSTNAKVGPKTVPKVVGRNGDASADANSFSNGTSKTQAKPTDKTSKAKAPSRPTPISITKTSASAKPSPASRQATPKTPTTPRQNPATDSSLKAPDKRLEKKSSKSSLAPAQASKAASKPTTSAGPRTSAPKTRIGQSPPQTGFVKPRPKSPTRPVKLPASLTAHTTSSGSKTASAAAAQPAPRQSPSRASGVNLPAGQSLSRSNSRASTVTGSKVSIARNPAPLRKSSSRPSLGPPPAASKNQSSRQSLTSQPPPPADESFLARMMRPTNSSSSKTAEKVPATPPKNTHTEEAKKLNVRDGPPVKAPVFAKSMGTTPKGGPKEVKAKSTLKEAKEASVNHKIADGRKHVLISKSANASIPKASEDVLGAGLAVSSTIDTGEPAPHDEAAVLGNEAEKLERIEDLTETKENIKVAATHEESIQETRNENQKPKEVQESELKPQEAVPHQELRRVANDDGQEPQEELEKSRSPGKHEFEHQEEDAKILHADEPKTAGVPVRVEIPKDESKVTKPSILTPKTPIKANHIDITTPTTQKNDDAVLPSNTSTTDFADVSSVIVEDAKPESISSPSQSTPSSSSQSATDTPSTPKVTNLTKPDDLTEDPEDLRARAEIVRLNENLRDKTEDAEGVD